MLLIASFILGTIIGSFANVFVLRYGTGRSLNGRSSCSSCSKKLSWYELIPVLSYLIQGGKCRSCQSRVSPQYIIVELIFGVVFGLCAYTTYDLQPMTEVVMGHWSSVIELIYLWIVSFLLLSISVYDIRHMIIPDGMLYVLGAVVLLWNVVLPAAGFQTVASFHPDILTSLIAGPLVALPFFLLWLVSHGRWMGFGDIKLSVVLGWMLGLLGGFSALIFGVWMGAVISLAIIGITRLVSRLTGLTMKSEIPFGPFLVAGTFLVLLTDITILTVMQLM